MRIAFRILGSRRPLRNTNDVETGQQELALVPGGNNVGEEEPDNLAPDDLLRANAKIPVAGREIKVVFAIEEIEALILFDRIEIEVGPVVHGIDVDSTTELPSHLICNGALRRQLEARDGARPVCRPRIGVRRQGIEESAELDARPPGGAHRCP